MGGSVSAGSTGEFSLQWKAEAGEHSYLIELYNLIGGQEFQEDSVSGKISVARADQQFAVSLEAFPSEVEGGGTVFFTVKGWNLAKGALNVQFHIVNESGDVIYPEDGGWASKYLPEGANNYALGAFSWDVYGVGNHTYTLVAKISGEEEKDTTTIVVKPVNGTGLKQVGAECSHLYFKYDMGNYKATLKCQLIIYNGYNYTLTVKGDINSKINASTLTPYLKLRPGASSLVVSSITPETISPEQYFSITSTAFFEIPKVDVPIIGDIFPYWEDAGGDINVEGKYGTMVPIKITSDVIINPLGDERFVLQGETYVQVDHIAVIADFASDAFFTYELKAKSLPVADLKFVQEISSRLPPQVQKALNPVLEQISVNWVTNWVKEEIITWWRG